MHALKTLALLTLCALVSVGCASAPHAPQPELVCPKPPAPPAWLMAPAPDLMTPLNGIISVSGTASPQPSSK